MFAGEIQAKKATCVKAFITRVDVKKQKLDGAARELVDSGQLIKDLGSPERAISIDFRPFLDHFSTVVRPIYD